MLIVEACAFLSLFLPFRVHFIWHLRISSGFCHGLVSEIRKRKSWRHFYFAVKRTKLSLRLEFTTTDVLPRKRVRESRRGAQIQILKIKPRECGMTNFLPFSSKIRCLRFWTKIDGIKQADLPESAALV